MSTRCQIKLKTEDESTNTVYLYKHHDGYPDGPHGVLKFLVPTVDTFIKNRGFDESYLLARIFEAVLKVVGPGFTGCGIDTVQHGDIDFLYEVDSEGSIWINGKKKTREQLDILINGK